MPQQTPGHRQLFDVTGFVLTALSLVTLLQGLAFIAEGPAERLAGVALTATGALLGWFAIRHARQHPAPMLDLRTAKEPSFVLSTLTAGFVCRVAINATPFLLPLMFQIGFKDSAFKAGLMLLAYMLGNLAMKTATTWMLKRHGFRKVLVFNGLGGALTIAASGLLSPAWPTLLMCVVLALAGMTRSMQFTALNTIAFADVPASARSSATTLSAMTAQVASALSVAFAALTLATVQTIGGGLPLALWDFQVAFVVTGLLMAAGSLWMLKLAHDVGAAVTAAR